MSFQTGRYSIEELLALRESPLVTKPDLPPQMEQWINQPAIERRNLQNAQAHNNVEAETKYRTADSRRSRGDSIVLGPPQMSFASSLHSPPLRKTSGKEPTAPTNRIRGSPPDDDIAASPPQDDEEEGWSKVRSGARGSASKAFERRPARAERRPEREALDALPRKATAFRNQREGESQNWRSERPEGYFGEHGRRDDGTEFFDGPDDDFGDRGGDGREHSAEEFQAWLAKMRGQSKPEDTVEKPSESTHQNGLSNEPPKVEKSKIVDVDSLFAFDSSTTDEPSSKGPMSSVFFDSVAPAGRASRFRQLFAQDSAPPPIERENRPPVDRMPSNSAFAALNKPSPPASAEDREGFNRIMAMLGGGGGPNPGRPAFFDKSPPLQQPPPPPMQDHPAQNESKSEFFQRLLRQGQPMVGNPPPAFQNQPMTSPPPMQMSRGNPMDQHRPSDMDHMHHPRMARSPQSQGQQRPSQQSHDPRYPPYDLPHHPPPPTGPPPQGAPWMHPPPGFSPPNGRYPFPGPGPLSPGMHPPPPPAGYGPPPPGMMPYGGPPPGFGRGGFSPPIPPPGQDGWHPPPGFGGGFYPEADNNRE